MTDEPIYEYVKGKGWVVQNPNVIEYITPLGRRVRITQRDPVAGERWCCGFHDLSDFRDHCSMFEFEDFSPWYEGRFMDPHLTYVTLEAVE